MVLLWLLPSVVVTLVAMAWIAWAGREGRGVVDREVALRRMADVLDPPVRTGRAARLARLLPGRRRARPVPSYAVRAPRDRSTGLAVRPSRSTSTGTSTSASAGPVTGAVGEAPAAPPAPPAPRAEPPRRRAS
ncbi:hypothetical protein [Nocardioides litoris]|uniref:hypothetical protein n=1 Tax=Nocardioides litoris TaxID=1926648 RepID=UPI00112429DA|nr:hypothetical protein [Nocardioides litoris]